MACPFVRKRPVRTSKSSPFGCNGMKVDSHSSESLVLRSEQNRVQTLQSPCQRVRSERPVRAWIFAHIEDRCLLFPSYLWKENRTSEYDRFWYMWYLAPFYGEHLAEVDNMTTMVPIKPEACFLQRGSRGKKPLARYNAARFSNLK